MAKIVDNYVLDKKIGSGQFGDVFRGWNKDTHAEVAIKVVRRASLKGKFAQLLENQIKVLRACKNQNIVRLYDLKKTANNFYLIMEFCNEGDLSTQVKQRGMLKQSEVLTYLSQILNGFRTLVQEKILHRDFKLANLLKHNGQIKIADFGFSKLLQDDDYTSTVLGSPLHMAPEVIGGRDYNNKADVWSVGTVIYEMLFGRPPYSAANMVELLNNIKKRPLIMPTNLNPISSKTEKMLIQMLTVDPDKRISFEELFEQVLGSKEDKKEVVLEMISTNGSMEEIMLKGAYSQEVTKRESFKQEKVVESPVKGSPMKESPVKEFRSETKESPKDSPTKAQQPIYDNNSKILVHYRDLYLFLASMAEDALMNTLLPTKSTSEIVAYLFIRKMLETLQFLNDILNQKQTLPSLEQFSTYKSTPQFNQIKSNVKKISQSFTKLFNQVSSNLQKWLTTHDDDDIAELIQDKNLKVDKMLRLRLTTYIRQLKKQLQKQRNSDNRHYWLHLDRLIDCLDLQHNFRFRPTMSFKEYYRTTSEMPLHLLINRISSRYI